MRSKHRTRPFKSRTDSLFVCLLLHGALAVSNSSCQDDKEKEEEKKEPPSPYLFEGEFKVSTESTPGNFTAREGKWNVDGEKKAIRLAPEPIVDGRVEFGPEIREKGATALTTTMPTGKSSRTSPWMGVGLYGKNGFALRLATGAGKIELVRRGENLVEKPFDWDRKKAYRMEISVQAEEENWIVRGRVWEAGEERPKKASLRFQAYADELLFPLAGRPFLLATPFAGEPVYFTEAKVLHGEFEPWMDDWRNRKIVEEDDDAPEKDEAEPVE